MKNHTVQHPRTQTSDSSRTSQARVSTQIPDQKFGKKAEEKAAGQKEERKLEQDEPGRFLAEGNATHYAKRS